MILFEMVVVPVPELVMPQTLCAVEVDVELAWMLFTVELPIVLLLIVTLPETVDLLMHVTLFEFVDALAVVIDPMTLFWQSTSPEVTI